MNEVIDEHLYREGFADTARKFEEEAHVALDEHMKESLLHLHTILQSIHKRDLQLAIQYASVQITFVSTACSSLYC